MHGLIVTSFIFASAFSPVLIKSETFFNEAECIWRWNLKDFHFMMILLKQNLVFLNGIMCFI